MVPNLTPGEDGLVILLGQTPRGADRMVESSQS